MAEIPRDDAVDSSLAFKSEGYRFIDNRCRRFDSDVFAARLLGRRMYFTQGRDAARMFYEPGRFTRRGALPKSALHLLQDEDSVATLDGPAHRRRKEMFLTILAPERLDGFCRLASDILLSEARLWANRNEVRLHAAFRGILCRAVCRWAGLDFDERQLEGLTREFGEMIDNAGSVGPSNWRARGRRRKVERHMARIIEDVRAARLAPLTESPLHAIAFAEDAGGVQMRPEIAAVELINILRPTVAVARFMTFAVLALHEHPDTAERVAADEAYREAFVQEVRRFYPFFPAVTGIAEKAFFWQGHRFERGDQFVLDLYGTDHDANRWEDARDFRPERFLGWTDNAFDFIPQGGGSHASGHRCPGEWLTIAVMKALLETLMRNIRYDVPPQDLSIDLGKMPALPASGFIVSNVRIEPH